MLMKAEKLSEISPDAISVGRESNLLLDHYAQSRKWILTLVNEQDKVPRGKPLACSHHSPKIFGTGNSLSLGKTKSLLMGNPVYPLPWRRRMDHVLSFRSGRSEGLNRQSFSSLRSPSPQNITTASGAHPLKETVGSFPSEITRLIGSLHRCSFPCF